MSTPTAPGLIRVRPKLTLEAMRWQPEDLHAVGSMAGWLFACGAKFDHLSGMGETTTLRIRNGGNALDTIARPGDWVVRGADRFMAWSPAVVAEVYDLIDPEATDDGS
jgi:hypothetical protein